MGSQGIPAQSSAQWHTGGFAARPLLPETKCRQATESGSRQTASPPQEQVAVMD